MRYRRISLKFCNSYVNVQTYVYAIAAYIHDTNECTFDIRKYSLISVKAVQP
jgi:hypothetical protein